MNENNKTVLLATFINHRSKVSSVLKLIAKNFDVINDRIFLLRDAKDKNSYVLSYNIVKQEVTFSDVIHNTISLHRKKETNTLYTLNALNEIVKLQNNGKEDSNFSVDWSDYKNCILLTKIIELGDVEDTVELRRIDTVLEKIIKLRKE